ncbi:MAG TPA: pyruvate dehydrogenase complex E1 component subunit beta [Blastocatellia bacterium]|nr:pyruvate dehydrogenase complex E1 component subunit beta [Blastocatellia bacterium]
MKMALMQFREALNQAMSEEMERDPNVFLMGEEVGVYNGAYKVSKGMLDRFGPRRVWDTPITELGFCGLGVGAAMVGLRPIIEMMTFNFSVLALDEVLNSAAKMLYMSGGQYNIPMVIRGPGGAAHMLSAQHSQALESWYAHIPGLKVVQPSNPYDAKGLLKTAIRDNDPVIFFESEVMYANKGEVPEEEYLIPIGVGDIKKEGKDITLVARGRIVNVTLEAAEALSKDGIDAEVIDLRTVRPLDEEIIINSVMKTNHAVVVEENWQYASMGSYIVDIIQKRAFDYLDAPIGRVHTEDVPMPYAHNLEKLALPSVDKIVKAVQETLA